MLILPTNVKLKTKRVPVSSICPQCQVGAETNTHSLVNCDFAEALVGSWSLGVEVWLRFF